MRKTLLLKVQINAVCEAHFIWALQLLGISTVQHKNIYTLDKKTYN